MLAFGATAFQRKNDWTNVTQNYYKKQQLHLPFVTDDGGQAICLNILLDKNFSANF